MVYGFIYRVTCLVTDKQYHGQTVNPRARWASHLRADGHCRALVNAVRKYGRKQFTFEVIAEASSKEELDVLEIAYVKTSMAPHGYNLKEGGATGRPSAETRLRISMAGRIVQANPEVKARVRAGLRAAMARPEVKAKYKIAALERAKRADVKANLRARMREVHARPGERERRGAAIKRSWERLSEDERAARIKAAKDGFTDEVRARIGATSRASLARPEIKAKHKQAIRDSYTPARREAASLRMQEEHAKPGFSERRGAAISKAHRTPEGQRKLAMRRRRNESEAAWRERIATSWPSEEEFG